ncbi:MAG: hypothetical protein NZ480_02825 [Bdellovibrionaceae bacterium]|nr:hypothetical protein [Pseudobdellovibrionaceae bacterium]MDW8190671.1 hypothetical protein [Pseudobdellovibrionaceae bacterium]
MVKAKQILIITVFVFPIFFSGPADAQQMSESLIERLAQGVKSKPIQLIMDQNRNSFYWQLGERKFQPFVRQTEIRLQTITWKVTQNTCNHFKNISCEITIPVRYKALEILWLDQKDRSPLSPVFIEVLHSLVRLDSINDKSNTVLLRMANELTWLNLTEAESVALQKKLIGYANMSDLENIYRQLGLSKEKLITLRCSHFDWIPKRASGDQAFLLIPRWDGEGNFPNPETYKRENRTVMSFYDTIWLRDHNELKLIAATGNISLLHWVPFSFSTQSLTFFQSQSEICQIQSEINSQNIVGLLYLQRQEYNQLPLKPVTPSDLTSQGVFSLFIDLFDELAKMNKSHLRLH